jgi:GT2 family glycosyltransferase
VTRSPEAPRPEEPSDVPDRELDVVICTYDNPVQLDLVLTALAGQQGAGPGWSVTVVDNNSGPQTREVVARHERDGVIPGLRRIVEPEQGLTPARLCGVRSSTGRWIAFVDDDCMLDDRWVAGALAFAAAHPDCGGFGGRVTPEYPEGAPSIMSRYGWAFAEQDLGEQPTEVDCLVGAGMVLNREALHASGWPHGPYFADRVGGKLVSGGDVEIALRVAATGRKLWYTPTCSLRHVIPGRRTTTRYLVRITRGLGVSFSLAQALVAPPSRRAWMRASARDLVDSLAGFVRAARRLFDGPDARLDAELAASYELGRWIGVARVAALMVRGRCEFFAQASARPADTEPDHAVHTG